MPNVLGMEGPGDVCVQNAQNDVEQRGLAAAGRPEDGDDLAVLHPDRDIPQHRHAVKGFADLFEFKHVDLLSLSCFSQNFSCSFHFASAIIASRARPFPITK